MVTICWDFSFWAQNWRKFLTISVQFPAGVCPGLRQGLPAQHFTSVVWPRVLWHLRGHRAPVTHSASSEAAVTELLCAMCVRHWASKTPHSVKLPYNETFSKILYCNFLMFSSCIYNSDYLRPSEMEDKCEIFFSKQQVPALFLLQQTAICRYLLLQLHPRVQENFMLSKLFLNSSSHFQQLFLQAFNLTFQIL